MRKHVLPAHCQLDDPPDPLTPKPPNTHKLSRNRIPRLLDPPKPYFLQPTSTNSPRTPRHPATRRPLTQPPPASTPHSPTEKCSKWPHASIEVGLALKGRGYPKIGHSQSENESWIRIDPPQSSVSDQAPRALRGAPAAACAGPRCSLGPIHPPTPF